ncbi:MAG: hypothetical protein R3E66_14815 [bacterium]
MEGDFFVLKRFLFHAIGALGHLEPLQRVCKRQAESLRALAADIHPEQALSARFLVSDAHDARLAEVRAAAKEARAAVNRHRRLLEARHPDLRFDVHGFATAHSGFEGGVGLKRSGDQWVLDDAELDALEDAHKGGLARVDLVVTEVLGRLSAAVVAKRDVLMEVQAFLVQVDQDLSRIRLCQELDGCFPTWSDDAVIEDGHAVDLTDAQRVSVQLTKFVVVTGPNMGGKSALLRLIGVCQWCLQHGMPAPARVCRLPGVAHVVYVGADLEERVEGLSAFGREVGRLVTWWDARDVLWLFDEIGRGTHPDEGAAIAREVVEARVALSDSVMVATHFPRVASTPGATCLRIAGITDAEPLRAAAAGRMDVDEALRRSMDYQPVPGDDVPRDARLVARALGLPIKDVN